MPLTFQDQPTKRNDFNFHSFMDSRSFSYACDHNEDRASVVTHSSISTNATADNLPGPGRLLGLFYSFAGRHLETQLGRIAKELNVEPHATSTTGAKYGSDGDQVSLVTCSSISTNATADNLPGAGRTVGLFYSFAGRILERRAGRIADELGFGPRATAIRIQKSRGLASSWITSKDKKIEKDCKRLLKYVGSNAESTKKQALDHITELSVYDEHVREILKLSGAVQTINLQRHHSAWTNSSLPLLSSSCKALVSLADTEVNTLAQELEAYILGPDDNGVRQLLGRMTHYLSDPDRSFLVNRHFTRLAEFCLHADMYMVIDQMKSVMETSPADFEWESGDQFFNALLTSMRGNPIFSENLPSLIEAVMQFADKLPRTVNSEAFRWFMDFDRAEDIRHHRHAYFTCRLLRDIPTITNSENDSIPQVDLAQLQALYPHFALKPLLRRLACRPDLILCEILNDRNGTLSTSYFTSWDIAKVLPSERLELLCHELSRFIDINDGLLRERALRGIRILLIIDRYCRAMMLQVLFTTRFASTPRCASFVAEVEELCIPTARTHDVPNGIYRHCDAAGNLIHVLNHNDECSCVHNGGTEHIMKIEGVDVLELHLPHGTSFSSAGHHPLLAGHNIRGTCMYLASYKRIFCTVAEGATLESVRILAPFPDGRVIKVHKSESLVVYVLRYVPDAYDGCARFAEHDLADGLDATGPFSWGPSGRLKPYESINHRVPGRYSPDALQQCQFPYKTMQQCRLLSRIES